ncbi:MAG: WYL domain-containing protein [Clostridia bacterium]|nr:WYL domain-containing protein [Clostridia bacterium]
MAKSSSQKLKILYLMKIFLERTDCEHSLTLAEIIKLLADENISAERKSLYDDINTLRAYGMNIETVRDSSVRYYLESRLFELPELKLLVDAVQASKFITAKKSGELIKKLEKFSSTYEAMRLNRQVYVSNRIKAMNESIYYNVDFIHNAINDNKKITFKYYEWTPEKEKRLRHDGALYSVSPWALTWDDEYYYMIAYDSAVSKIKHYRVDKMVKISISDEKREGSEVFEDFDMAIYSKQTFGMFGGELTTVRIECDNSLAGVVIDRFGTDVTMLPRGEKFEASIRVMVSPTFISWALGFGSKLKILSPTPVAEMLKDTAKAALSMYD